MSEPQTMQINDVEYIRKDSIKGLAVQGAGMDYVIVRTEKAGVFAGYLELREGTEANLVQARRLYYWEGAATLSQLSQEGVSKPKSCKFPCEVQEIILLGVIEIIACTEQARLSIKDVSVWSE